MKNHRRSEGEKDGVVVYPPGGNIDMGSRPPAKEMERLRSVFKMAMNDSEFLDIMKKMYIPAVYRTPEEYKKLMAEGYGQMEKLIREIGLHKSRKKN